MNIISLQNNAITSFKSYQDDGIIGYDDSISKDRRNAIREHYNSWHMPYQSIYDKNHRLTDYQMQLIIKNLEENHEMQRIKGTSIYRGQTLVDKPHCLHNLKNFGINTVIDLVGYGKYYEDSVKEAGLKYHTYNIYENWWNNLEVRPRHIEKLVNFICEMQKGNIYIGCEHGSNDTDIALILNNFFNPLFENKEAKTKIMPNDSDFPIKLNIFYDNMTKQHKQKMGWTKEFEQKLIKKLIAI